MKCQQVCYPYFHERAIVMSRLVYSVVSAVCLSFLTLSVAGCGGAQNEVVEDTRSIEEIEQEQADYEAMMEETSDEVTE